MLKKERQALILQQLNIHNRVLSCELLEKFSVSEDTIRRDLQELSDEGRLIKVHGGALSKGFHFTLSSNEVYLPEEKRTIAQKAAELIKDGMLVLLSGGTTIMELVHALPSTINATFVTPSVPMALELMNNSQNEVIFIGNKLNRDAQMAVGAEVVRQLQTLHADICFMGTNAIDAVSGITESIWEIIEVKKEMRRASGKLVSLAISEKLNTVQPFQVCAPSEIDYLVTELPSGHPSLQAYKQAGIAVL